MRGRRAEECGDVLLRRPDADTACLGRRETPKDVDEKRETRVLTTPSRRESCLRARLETARAPRRSFLSKVSPPRIVSSDGTDAAAAPVTKRLRRVESARRRLPSTDSEGVDGGVTGRGRALVAGVSSRSSILCLFGAPRLRSVVIRAKSARTDTRRNEVMGATSSWSRWRRRPLPALPRWARPSRSPSPCAGTRRRLCSRRTARP